MATFLSLLWGLAACEPPPATDLRPPRLLATEVSADGRELGLDFDEPLAHAETAIDDTGGAAEVEGNSVRVPLPSGLKAGAGHVFSAEVADPQRNVTSVEGKFYAANLHPAGLRLNEVRVAGSGNHTDMVELRVEAPGSLGGWTLEVWSGPETRQRLVLPDQEVETGELVVVRYKLPQTATDSGAGAHEYWQPEGKGLPGTKGLIALRQRPDGAVTDGLLYAVRPADAQAIAEAAGWDAAPLDPTGCTATRTWCRTDSTPAWMIVATGAATPGSANKLTPWPGPTSSRGGPPKTKGRTIRRPRGRASPSRRGSSSRSGQERPPGARPGGRIRVLPGHRWLREQALRLPRSIGRKPPGLPALRLSEDEGGAAGPLLPAAEPRRRPPAADGRGARRRPVAATPGV